MAIETGKTGWLPKTVRDTIAATTLLTTTGAKAAVLNEPRISSRAKKAPASGALKAAEMPAAAPAPTRMRVRSPEKRKSALRREAMSAPKTATGPSLPAEPPLPIVIALAAVRASAGRVGISPWRRTTARCTSGMLRPSLPLPESAHRVPGGDRPGGGEHRAIGEPAERRQQGLGPDEEHLVGQVDEFVEADDAQSADQPDDARRSRAGWNSRRISSPVEPVDDVVPDALRGVHGPVGGAPGPRGEP